MNALITVVPALVAAQTLLPPPMSDPSPHRTPTPQRRLNTIIDESALDADDASPVRVPGTTESTPQGRRPTFSGRVSFSGSIPYRSSILNKLKGTAGDEESGSIRSPRPERPAIPSALQQSPEVYSTPLPILSMIVLSIVRHTYLSLIFGFTIVTDYAWRVLICKCVGTIFIIHGRKYVTTGAGR